MVQQEMNQEAIDMLPRVKSAISKATAFGSNQMYHYTLRECNNSSVALCDMSSDQIELFQDRLFSVFENRGWI